ncbi:SDR family NAD(P)-dependent oxidoreductase [Pseudomonadota bacterium]
MESGDDGANRGIGAGFVRHYLESGCSVWACFRRDSGELNDISSERLHRVQWDVGLDLLPQGSLPEQVDLLINNAGIYGPGKGGQSLDNITTQAMLEVFNIDCIGPLRVVKQLKERLIKAKGAVANISSKMGSSGDNSSGGTYAYRAAKAGLVIVSKSMAIDLGSAGVRVITLHPGWVETDMTHQTGLIDIETSVAGMSSVIERVDTYEAGSFIAFDGKVVPY